MSKDICSRFRSNEKWLRREQELYILGEWNLYILMMHTQLFYRCGPFPNWEKFALQVRQLNKAFAFFAGIRWASTFHWSRGQKPSKQPPKQPRKPLLLLPEPWSDMIDCVCVISLDAFHWGPHLFSQESARFPRRWPTMDFLNLISHQWFSGYRSGLKVTQWSLPGALQTRCVS